jgi:hypothetical protein
MRDGLRAGEAAVERHGLLQHNPAAVADAAEFKLGFDPRLRKLGLGGPSASAGDLPRQRRIRCRTTI